MYTDDGTNDPNGRSTSVLQQESSNPSVYTKLSCFLPWIAEQYNMEYDASSNTDEECEAGGPVKDQINDWFIGLSARSNRIYYK